MRSLRLCIGWITVVGLGAACGGSSFTSAPTGSEEGGVEGSAGAGEGGAGSDAGGGDATSPADAQGDARDAQSAQDGNGGATDGAAGQDSGDAMAVTDAPSAPCPDVRGTYSVTIVGTGPVSTGCGDLNTSAPQCIREPVGSCTIEFRSSVSGGGPVAIAGSAMLQNDGVFDSATLVEGTATRSGCTGVWNPTTSAMTVDCGGTGTTQSCIVKLTRTGPVGAVCN